MQLVTLIFAAVCSVVVSAAPSPRSTAKDNTGLGLEPDHTYIFLRQRGDRLNTFDLVDQSQNDHVLYHIAGRSTFSRHLSVTPDDHALVHDESWTIDSGFAHLYIQREKQDTLVDEPIQVPRSKYPLTRKHGEIEFKKHRFMVKDGDGNPLVGAFNVYRVRMGRDGQEELVKLMVVDPSALRFKHEMSKITVTRSYQDLVEEDPAVEGFLVALAAAKTLVR